MSTATLTSARDAACGGKYLTFFLADEEYGVAVVKVQEIIGLQAIMRVPQTPTFVRGVISRRGSTLPLVDLRERLGMPPADVASAGGARQIARAEALRCIVVVEVARGAETGREPTRRVPMGIVVDRLSEVAWVDAEQIEAPSMFGARARTDFLLGLATGGRRVWPLLDIDRVLASDDEDAPARVAA